MIYKNVEIHNVEELIHNSDGSVSWLRIPRNIYDTLEITEQGQAMAKNSTGVELRFVLRGDKAIIKMSAECGGRFHVYRGGVQGAWYDHESDKNIGMEPKEYIIPRSENSERLKIINDRSGCSWDSEVIRIIFDRGNIRLYDISGDVEIPQNEQYPNKTMLCYGSSITHGSNALDMSHSWVSVLAHKLNMDVRNLGMAGCCAMELEFAEYIASEGEKGKWDIAILELGINVLGWDEGKILDRAENIIKHVAGRNPDKKVYVISPFYYCGEDIDNNKDGDKWRRLQKHVTDQLAFSNVTYINGIDIIDNMSYMSADEVHPNIYGMTRIADMLFSIIKH